MLHAANREGKPPDEMVLGKVLISPTYRAQFGERP